MAWLERHELCIVWNLKTISAMRTTHSRSLASHKPDSDMQIKRYWSEKEPNSVKVLDIGMSEIKDTVVTDESPQRSSRVVASNPLNDGISLHSDSMVGRVPEHMRRGPSDVGSVVSKNPLSDSISLNA